MKKNLLFTTALCAAALCFADTAKADNLPARLIVNTENTEITQDVIGLSAPTTSEAAEEGQIAWGTGVGTYAGDNGIRGGAIVNYKHVDATPRQTVTIADDVKVKDNTALGLVNGYGGIGGAIINFHGNTLNVGNNVEFSGNQAKDAGGAIWSEGEGSHPSTLTVGDNVSFTNNTAIDDMAGAVGIMAKQTATFGANVTFTGNSAGRRGGAVGLQSSNWGGGVNDGLVTASFGANAKFISNTAGNGGAVWNKSWDYDGVSDGSTVSFGAGAYFEGNVANGGNGGAVYNSYVGEGDSSALMTFANGAVFKDNTAIGAASTGGAIYNNNGVLTFGNVVFSGNKVGADADHLTLNDIHNTGVINFNGETTLDGGIAGTGTVTFADGATLNATLQTTFIEANTVTFGGNNTLNLTVANGLANAEYDFIHAVTLNGEEGVTIAENAIYNLALTDEGKISVAVKSAQEIVEIIDVPVQAQEAQTLSAVISSNGNGTGIGNAIADRISAAMQGGNAAAAVQAVKDLAPTTSQQVMGVAQGVSNMLSNVTGGRMAAVSGRSGGDMFTGGSVWAQTLFNHTKQDGSKDAAGFRADSTGIAMGVDGKVNDSFTIGFGYGFTRTNSNDVGRKVDVEGHNFFVYGSYQPSAWYVDTMLSYGVSHYTEKKAPMGVAMLAKYDVNTFAANVMTGYGFDNGITPEGGLRYVLADQESYNDGAQRISSDNNDVLTAVMGVKYEKSFKAKKWTIKPNMRLAATYDLISDDTKANINIIGGGNYEITGKRLNRLGGEAGAGVTGTIGKFDVSLEYNGSFRHHYKSNTGMLKVQYNF